MFQPEDACIVERTLALGTTPVPERWYPPPGYVDPLDSTGRRCTARSAVGACDRRHDHVDRGDAWHHAMTNYDPTGAMTERWRWR
jgi:hypothetical protein